MARNDDNMNPQTTPSPFSFGSSRADVPGQADGSAKGNGQSDPFGTHARGGQATVDALFAAPSAKADDPGVALGYRKSVFGHKDEVSVYTAQMDARHAVKKNTKVIIVSSALVVVMVFLVAVLPSGLFGPGKPAVTIAYLIEALSNNVTGFANWVTGGPVTTGISITFWQVLAVAVAGAALALNGCVFQGALKNPLAAPSTLGVISGGTLGTLAYTLAFGVPATASVITIIRNSELQEQLDALDPLEYVFAIEGRALCSLAGCFAVVALVLAIAHIAGRGKVSKVALLIAGQVFTALTAGVVSVIRSYLMVFGTIEQQEALQSIVGGSVSSITTPFAFVLMAAPVLIGIVVIMALRFRLNILAFNDEDAKSMGINTTATRNGVILVCTILTGVVISFVGSVGFVGFLVPHLARRIVGPDFRYLVPASALFGSIFLLLAYYLMNLTGIFAGSLGTLTSIVGAVSFLVIAVRERARGNVDWI